MLCVPPAMLAKTSSFLYEDHAIKCHCSVLSGESARVSKASSCELEAGDQKGGLARWQRASFVLTLWGFCCLQPAPRREALLYFRRWPALLPCLRFSLLIHASDRRFWQGCRQLSHRAGGWERRAAEPVPAQPLRSCLLGPASLCGSVSASRPLCFCAVG